MSRAEPGAALRTELRDEPNALGHEPLLWHMLEELRSPG